MTSKYKPKRVTSIVCLCIACMLAILVILRWAHAFNSNIVVINQEISSHISNFLLSLLFIWPLDTHGYYKAQR